MGHLTEEQFEDILQGRAEIPAHAEHCPQCRARIEEKRIVARRIAQAFTSVHAGPDLVARIQAQIAVAGRPPVPARIRSRAISRRIHRVLWPGLAVAAAVVLMAILRSSVVDPVARARAAQTALVGIHRINLDSDPGNTVRMGRHCRCVEGKVDGPAMPCCERQLCQCGCQMREFQGRQIPSCVIVEPNGVPVSVVVVSESPEALGMTSIRTTTATGQTVWQARRGSYNMAAVHLGEECCCVIGHVPPDDLVALLNAMGG